MALELKHSDCEKLFGSFQDMGRFQAGPDGYEAHWEWPEELGQGFMNLIKIRPGLIVGIADYRLKEDLIVGFEHEHPSIYMGFSLSGDVTYQVAHENGCEDAYHYKNRHGTVNCLPSCQGSGFTQSDIQMAYVRIHAQPRIFKELLPGHTNRMPLELQDIISGDTDACYCHVSALNPLCNMVARQIMDCPYQGPLRRLYLEGKTLELISHILARWLVPHAEPDNNAKFYKDDVERVFKAEHLLNRSIENPPSLAELARKVGLNKNKLNQGFRQQFGASVFEHLRIRRLEQARKLLQARESNVTEVAFKVGYKHHGNFTRAFKKHFGTTPYELIA